MKKFIWLITFSFLWMGLFTGSTQAQYKAPSPMYGSDIALFDYSDCTLAKSHLYVANNGWIYVIGRLDAPTTNYQAWRVFVSTDDGQTFSQVCQWEYNTDDWVLQDCDIVVTGEDPSDMRLWILEVTNSGNVNPHNAYVRLNEFDANGALVGQPYYLDYGAAPNALISCAIATDYRSPGSGMSPFGIGIAFVGDWTGSSEAAYGYSLDGGATFNALTPVDIPGTGHLGRVSLSLGATLSNGWGRMAMAFEMDVVGGFGNIGVLSNYTDFAGSAWTTPVAVNLTYGPSAGFCRYPVIRIQDNASVDPTIGSDYVPIVVAYEDWSSGPAAVDIMYNSLIATYTDLTQPVVSDFTCQWLGSGNGFNEGEPAISFDKAYDNFLLTYSSTQGNTLLYKWTSMNDILGYNWTDFGNYRDNSSPMIYQVQPKVDINPTIGNGACFSWTEASIQYPGMQQIMFDAEWSVVGVGDNQGIVAENSFKLTPNPAKEKVTLSMSSKGTYTITLTSLLGQEVLTQTVSGSECILQLGTVPSGIYMVRVNGNGMDEVKKLIIN